MLKRGDIGFDLHRERVQRRDIEPREGADAAGLAAQRAHVMDLRFGMGRLSRGHRKNRSREVYVNILNGLHDFCSLFVHSEHIKNAPRRQGALN